MTDSATTGPVHPVLLVNPRSGGEKAQRYDLVARCRARGIEAVVMKEGDDLASLAAAAVSSGADVVGMAGGDGSQAIVAAVASRHDIPYVCIPAGTRNHFALDIGVDRDDVIGALDAFHRGSERRIDLGQVNGRVFVNNASIGFYGKVVQSPEYRDAKLRTVIEMLPDLLGPGATPFDLRFSDPGERNTRRLSSSWCPTTATSSTRSALRAPGDDGRRDARRGGGARRTAVAPPAGMDHPSLRDRLRGHDRRRTGRRGRQARVAAPIRGAPGGPAHLDSGRRPPSRAAAAQAEAFFVAVGLGSTRATTTRCCRRRPRVHISKLCVRRRSSAAATRTFRTMVPAVRMPIWSHSTTWRSSVWSS